MSNNKKERKSINKEKLPNPNHNINENADSIYSIENNDVLDNLIKLSGNQEVYKELKEETGKIKQLLAQSKEKLENINLYEKQKSDIDIYQWNNLFNRSIPITSYVASSSYIKKQNKKMQKEENKNASDTGEEKNKVKHPIVLVDLTNEEMKKYLPPEPIGIPPSSVIRFQQLPFRGDSNNVFYFSNAFNDYYKMDFKQFIKRMPILKAKKRCESAKLSRQIKATRIRNIYEEKQKEILKNNMMNRLNNLYIEKQYLSLSSNAKNIQPLISSLHAQIYPGKEDELTKHTKIYIKTNKPLGSERNVDDIDYSVNDRDYQRNELQRIRELKKRRPKSTRKRVLSLPKYDINDPDIAIFSKLEMVEDNENNDVNDNQFFNENLDGYLIESDRNIKKKKNSHDFKNYTNVNYDIRQYKKLDNKDAFSFLEESKNNSNNYTKYSEYKLAQRNKNQNIRASSAKRYYSKRKEMIDINRNQDKFKRSMSAQGIRNINRNSKPFIHKVYLCTKNRMCNSAFYKRPAYINRNKIGNGKIDEKSKGNSSSQISTYEGINNSIYENQNGPRYRFPFKNNHQIENKIYQKINKRLKERQYEKDKQKLEEFSKLIHLDDAILSDDFSKDKFNNSNNIGNNTHSGLIYLEKSKSLSRPLSSNPQKIIGKNLVNNPRNNILNINKPMTPKILRYNKSNNNFRAASKKSSNENSKLDFTTSVLNTKHEYWLNNNNDKVTFIYFNDVIENKPQKISDGKPVIKNDRIIVGANFFNRSKPQMLTSKTYFRNKRSLRRVKSSKNSLVAPKLKDNVIIQEEHF